MKAQADDNSKCVCKKTLADHPHGKWIKCEKEGCCSPWWHVACAGLENITDAAIKKITYTCPRCVISSIGLTCVEKTSYTKDISEEIKKCLPEIVKVVVKEASETVSKSYADAVKEENKVLLEETVKVSSKKAIDIIHDKEIREKNVVIFNVIESTKDSKEECIKEDEAFFTELCEEVKIGKQSIIKVVRIGKKENDKNRPLKVCFCNEFDKRKFFANLYYLKNSEEKYRKVQVQHDLSKEERETIKNLGKEADEKNSQEKPKDFLYRVRGSPGAMKIVKVYKRN